MIMKKYFIILVCAFILSGCDLRSNNLNQTADTVLSENINVAGNLDTIDLPETEFIKSDSVYTQWAIPEDKLTYVMPEYYDKNDCLGLAGAWTYGGDLISTLIANSDFYSQQQKHLVIYNPIYLKNLDKKLADYLLKNYNQYYYAYYTCHLEQDIDLIAAYLVPSNITAEIFKADWENNSAQYNKNLIIINKDQIALVTDLPTLDHTLTGGEVYPCVSQYENQQLTWTCISPKRFVTDSKGNTSGVYYDNWLLDLSGKILKKWETTK